MKTTRVENTRRNIFWSYIDFAITIIFQFVSRTIIINVLGAQYLGLSSLFSSILQVLNMAELGFSGAVVYNLYKPIADNDVDTVCALLAFYRKVYRIVGCIIISVGLILTPFLPNLINGSCPEDINYYCLYLLYLANTGISYFLFAYKASLLNALQRMDLVKIAYCIINIGQCVFQILVLLLFGNYYLFVIGTIIGSASKNLLAAYFAQNRYPQFECRGKIHEETRQSIWKRVKGLLICRISGVTYTTFDSIILSAMLGLVPVAIYNNYLTIYGAVANVIVLIRHAMQASVGNSVASESLEKNYNDVFVWQFLFSIISIFCSTCLMCLYQPFMTLWMGKGMILTETDVLILSLLFYVSTVQHAFYLYLSGNGLWWELRWPYILSTITNLVLNVLLCRIYGITGIILATLIAQLVFGFIWHSAIIFKYYFNKSVIKYWKKQVLYTAVGISIGALCYSICHLLSFDNIWGLMIKALVCVLLCPVCLNLAFRTTREYSVSIDLALRFLKR